jgi:HK97 family phage major capsid protein
MTLFTTTDDVSGLLPEDYGSLVIQPVQAASVALEVASTVLTDSHVYHVPILTEDATASWVKEGDDLASGTEPTFDELAVTPSKVGDLVLVSNELADDSSPEATEQVGLSIGRGIAARLDEAFFGDHEYTDPRDPRPKGLEQLPTGGTGVQEVGAGEAFDNLDPFALAIALSQEVGGAITSFVGNPADYRSLMTLKREVGSNEPLLGANAMSAQQRLILGVPLLASRFVEPGTIWAIDKRFATVVLRKQVTLEVSRDYAFNTDRTAVKATMRAGFAFTNPKALVKITLGAEA